MRATKSYLSDTSKRKRPASSRAVTSLQADDRWHTKVSVRNLITSGISRADDLESLFYLIMFLLNGQLPWLDKKAIFDRSQRLTFNRTREIKSQSFDKLWPGIQGTSYPSLKYIGPLRNMAYYIMNLHFEEDPDYQFLERCLMGLAH